VTSPKDGNGALTAPAAVLEGLPDAVVGIAPDGRIVFVNVAAEELFGYPRAELVGQPVQLLWAERVRERYTRNMRLYFEHERPLRYSTEVLGRRRDGSEFVGEMNWGVVRAADRPLLLAIGRDISQRRAAERRMNALAAIGERALAAASPDELVEQAEQIIRSTLPIAAAHVQAAGAGHAEADVVVPVGPDDELVVQPGHDLSVEELTLLREVAGTLATALARVRDDERMRHEALHDPLTGLANRTLLLDRLELALARAERAGDRPTVLFIDLDNFKEVNDEHGHAAGDAVLVTLGDRLRAAVRPADTVTRLGGDEFVVLCEQIGAAEALSLAERLEVAIREPVSVGDAEHSVSASIGIAVAHSDADTAIAEADAAVYRAKAAGGGRVVVS
jgi:diguanylate cyclase (GGDEF)-like protein/PAS domain S-box-containing protein